MTASGNVVAFSDIKLKTNITNIDNALQKTLQLRGVYYNKKDNIETRKVGVIAQEILEVLPEVVMTHVNQTTKEETLAVDYGNIVGLLIEAIKELNEEVQYLKSKIPNQ
jgi:broad-specificity NMP kinase